MSHDKIKAAARKRMAQTGEPYAAARRAVATGRRAAGGQIPSPGAGYALRMSGEIHDWLADLSGSDPTAAMRVGQALAALMNEGVSLGDPLVVSTADSWPWALAEALDRSYQEGLERLQLLRRRVAGAATLVRDIQDQVAELESAQAKLEDIHRRAQDAARPQEAAQAASKLAAAQQQAAEVRRLLPGVIEAGHRLGEATQRLQARADAARARKEVLKASYIAAHSSLEARKTIAASLLTGDDDGRPEEDSGEAISTAEARLLRDVIAQMERELGQQAWPEGLMELRPGAPDTSIRILFALEPPGTALLIAVLEGLEAVRDQYLEAILLSADMLRQVRAGQAPEAAAHAYDDIRSFLEELYPGNHDDADTSPH
jgi:phage shock protein A